LYNLEKKQNSLLELKKKLKHLQETQALLIKQQKECKKELNENQAFNEINDDDKSNYDDDNSTNIDESSNKFSNKNKENNNEIKNDSSNSLCIETACIDKGKQVLENNKSNQLNPPASKNDLSNEYLNHLNNLLHDILLEETNDKNTNSIKYQLENNDIIAKLIEINKKQEELKKLREYMDYLKEYSNMYYDNSNQSSLSDKKEINKMENLSDENNNNDSSLIE